MTADGASFSFMLGTGETHFAAFALALGLGGPVAGLVASVPVVMGAVLQLISLAAIERLGSHRRWVVICARVQALTFLPLIAAGLIGALPVWALLAVVSVYWGAGMATSPAWNAWVGELVPQRVRARYFARRARVSQAALALSLLGGGVVLELADREAAPLLGFALLFALAGGARLASSVLIASQSEPPDLLERFRTERAAGRLAARPMGRRRMLAYMLALTLSTFVAAPYFTPYMLGPLGLSYAEYVALLAAAFMARIASLPALGRVAQSHGPRLLLRASGIAVAPIAALWLVSDRFVYLLLVQVAAGAAWGAYELATALLLFDAIDARDRTRVLTLFNLAHASALVGGALLGGAALDALGADATAYHALFVISSLARLASLALLRGVPDAPTPDPLPELRTLAVRPSLGAIQRVVLPTLDGDTQRPPEE